MMFNDFKKNIYSQNGEDGILEEVLKKLDLKKNGWCCEFGAWDGKHGSNTFNLVKNLSHPNFYLIDLLDGKKIIEISQIRKAIAYSQKSSFNDKYRIVLIIPGKFFLFFNSFNFFSSISGFHHC